jgi:drug/metabolite transporter (DMT)-like permease
MSKHDDNQATSTRKAVLAALASSVLFAAMAMVTRQLSHTIPGHQVALVRFAIGVAAVLGFLGISRADLRPRRWGWVISRGVFGGTAVLLYFTCIEKIGVGIATLLNYTAPVWSMMFAWLLLRERPRRHAFVALGLTLVGVALVTSGRAGVWRIGKWELVGAGSAVVSGMAITSIRATRRHSTNGLPSESSWTVFASFTVLGLFTTLPTAFPPLGAWVAPTPRAWLLLVVCGCLGVAAQLLMTSAFGMLTAVGMGILQQSTVVLTMVGGLLFFGEPIAPRAAVGSIITIAGVVWSVLVDRQNAGTDA